MDPTTNVFKSRADKSPMDDSFFSEDPVMRREKIKGLQQTII